MSQSVSDICLLEMWLGMGDVSNEEASEAYCRVQARMLVVQAILWPREEQGHDVFYEEHPEECE